MDYKLKNLYNKIYVEFIRGSYGQPKIPTKAEVISKLEEITSQDYVPLTTFNSMRDIDINYINQTFSNVIDDIDILFDSIESESRDVLDQLTGSLKEHNGVKRELRRIKATCDDISNGKIGEEYLNYNFSETFDNSENINTLRSDAINFEAGIFTIRKDADKILTLNHYIGTKLEFSIIENYAQIIENGYVGSTDAAAILDQQDPRQLIYKITTNRPTRLRTAFSLQLTPDSREIDINSVEISVDSDIAKGYIRLYYRSSYKWNDVSNASIQEIKGDKVTFNFSPVKCSHVKIEFIKDEPDVFDTNTYYYIINNIAIAKSTTKKSAILYSNPITVERYSNELPIIASVAVSGDLEIPKGTEVKLFVTQDILISGAFLSEFGSIVSADSPEAYIFDQSYSGTVFLSDLWNAEDAISGVSCYKGIDYEWKPLKFYGSNKETLSEIVEFENTKRHEKIDNSLFTVTSYYLFGDTDYTGVYTLSGWVNTSNPQWALLEPYVASGVYVSGVDVATALSIAWEDIEPSGILNAAIIADPRYSGQWLGYNSGVGYPFNYYAPALDRVIRFNEYDKAINGWWRPYSFTVTPTGIDDSYADGIFLSGNFATTLPDFFFNNIPFYKIYKFNYNDVVIDPTIKLFTYQERPINNNLDYFPCNFVWKYQLKWIDQVNSKVDAYDSRMLGATPPTGWQDYVINIPIDNLRINEEYIVDSISEVKIHGSNSVLEDREYQIIKTGDKVTGIDLSSLADTRPFLKVSGVTFDYKYKYRVKNEYLSTWTAFVIVSPGDVSPNIQISNVPITGKENLKIIGKIDVENLDTGVVKTYLDDGGIFNIVFPKIVGLGGNSHYKITLYCSSDNSTGFCANGWVPYESSNQKDSTIIVSPLVRIVQKLNPLNIVDISDLIYDTPMNNDNRAAIILLDNGEKYLIAKIPSKDTFPGYYYNSLEKKYNSNSDYMIENNGHWVRRGVFYENVSGILELSDEFTYTTGSSGLYVYEKDRVSVDYNWNNGATLVDYLNTKSGFFIHHSTINYPINIDRSDYSSYTLRSGMYDPRAPYDSGLVGSNEWRAWIAREIPNGGRDLTIYDGLGYMGVYDLNRGFLFYSTAENLPSFYSISYRTVSNIDDTNTRFLYKLELSSDDEGSLVPKVKSLRFIINEKL